MRGSSSSVDWLIDQRFIIPCVFGLRYIEEFGTLDRLSHGCFVLFRCHLIARVSDPVVGLKKLKSTRPLGGLSLEKLGQKKNHIF